MRCFLILLAAMVWSASSVAQPRNIILFVADGLRHGSVNATDAPTLFSLREHGVDFANSHSLYPTLTTPNASAIATGHYLADTGDFGNTLYAGFPIFNSGNFGRSAGANTPFVESDPVLGDLDGQLGQGNYLHEETLLSLARSHGYNTAAIGKLGPVAIQDIAELAPDAGHFQAPHTVILDDSTGTAEGVPLPADLQTLLTDAGLSSTPTARAQPVGNVSKPGTLSANVAQQKWFADATTRAVLPAFVRSGKPFMLVYWSRDPDGSQHNQGDSLNKLRPGIDGPTSRAGVANADSNLRQILDYLERDPALLANTDVLVTSDHGFETISKHETGPHGEVAGGYSTTFTYNGPDGQPEVLPTWLPPGFLALDLAHELGEPLFDPDSVISTEGISRYAPVDPSRPASATSRQRPAAGNANIGGQGRVQARTDAHLIIAANGGSDLIYIPRIDASHPPSVQDRALARRVVNFLSRQSYVGALFVDASFGSMEGALPLSAIRLEGSALTPRPAIVVGFKTFQADPGDPLTSVEIADTVLQEGQGMHGSLSRGTTFNNMAALGPDFKQGFVSHSPVSNADIVPTIAHILGFELQPKGKWSGRVLRESLVGGPQKIRARSRSMASNKTSSGKRTVLELQEADGRRYFDRACFTAAARCPPSG